MGSAHVKDLHKHVGEINPCKLNKYFVHSYFLDSSTWFKFTELFLKAAVRIGNLPRASNNLKKKICPEKYIQ